MNGKIDKAGPYTYGRLNIDGWRFWLYCVGVYFSMVLGMISKALHDSLVNANEIEFVHFIVPMTVSPIVFGGILQIIRNPHDKFDLLGVVAIGFQNGFFWQDVLGSAGIQ